MRSGWSPVTILLRPEAPGDARAIEAVTIAAFLHAPHAGHTEQFVIRDLRKAGMLTVTLVAEEDGEVVGHVAVSPVAVSDGSPGWYGLGPLSVLPSHQRRGLGSRLVRAAMDELRAIGAAGCVLLGDPAYYGRFGFRAEPNLVLPGFPAEYFQVLALEGEVPTGTVTYHPAFDATE